MATYSWIGGTIGDWATAADWSPTGVPGIADDALFPSSFVYQASVTADQATNILQLDGTGTLDVTAGVTLDISGAALVSAQLVLAGAGAVLAVGTTSSGTSADLTVGYSGAGAITVDGGTLTSATEIIVGAAEAGSLSIEDAGSLFATDATYGLAIGSSIGSSGFVSLDASSSLVLGEIDIGDRGVGTLEIVDGAQFTSAAPSGESVGAFIGKSADTAGSLVAITGVGSQWMMSGGLQISGNSTLTVLDGGAFHNTLAASAAVGLSVGNAVTGTLDSAVIVVAGTTGLASIVNVGTSTIAVGVDAVGSMFVQQGGQVFAAAPSGSSAMALGETGTGVGFLTVSDAGSLVDLTGELDVGLNGFGAITVESGATLDNGNGNVGEALGVNAGAHGLLVVQGAGSVLNNSGQLWVGSSGAGTLDVLGGALLSLSDNFYPAIPLSVSNNQGGSGTVLVSGAGSSADIAGNIDIADYGMGALFIDAGGSVSTTGSLLVGNTVAATGVVVVDGAGSRLSVAGDLNLGGFGIGGAWYLQATDGGNVDAAGSFYMADGAEVSADASSGIEIGGTAAILGGAIRVEAGATLDGSGTIKGTLTDLGLVAINGGGELAIDGAASGGMYIASEGGTLTFEGTVSGSINLEFNDGFLLPPTQGTVLLGPGATTVSAADGPGTIETGIGQSALVFTGDGNMVDANGADTIVAGTGAATVNVSGAGALVYTDAAAVAFGTLGAASTVIGGAAGVTLLGASGGGVVFGSTEAGNLLESGTDPTTLVGGYNGDVLTADNASNDVLVAGAGAETLNAAASRGYVAMFAGAGAASLQGGRGTALMIAGTGDATMTGGAQAAGGNIFAFIDGVAGGSDVVTNFDPARDLMTLFNYSVNEVATALAGAKLLGSSLVLTLSDNTQVTFLNTASLSPTSVIGV